MDSFLTTEVEMSRLTVDAGDGPAATVQQLQERILQLESDLTKSTRSPALSNGALTVNCSRALGFASAVSDSKESESERSVKRQRLAIESIAVSKVALRLPLIC